MSKFVNAVVLGLVSFILILAIFWYVVEIRQESQVSITNVGVAWGPVNNRTTELAVRLTVFNPHKSPVVLEEVQFEVLVNGNQLDDGRNNESLTIAPEQSGTKEFRVTVPSRFVVDWIDSHLENDERSKMVVKGEARFAISTLRSVATFDWESSWEGIYVDGFQGTLHNCPSTDSTPCIERTKASWDTTGTQSVLQTEFSLRNPNGYALRIKSWSVDLVLHDTVVARGGTPAVSELPANGTADVRTPVVFERLQLPQWWPSHVRDCERSATTVVIRYVTEQEGEPADNGTVPVVLTNIEWRFVGPLFDTRFVCQQA